MPEEALPTSGKFNVQRHELQFRCEWAVFPDGGEASVCYCTDEARALLVAKALDEMFERKRLAAECEPPDCPYCGQKSEKVTGSELYPRHLDLARLSFYVCKPCDARVGCNSRTGKVFGTLANKELRELRPRAHLAFDAIWEQKMMSRTAAYAWLASELGIDMEKCHMGMFDGTMCLKVIEVSKAKLASRREDQIPF